MKSKKIWYCHPTAGHGQQSMSFRPYYLAKYWKQAGHQPYIISSSFHHLLNHPTKQKEAILAKSIENVDYIFLKTTKYNSNGVKRIFSMLSYSLRFILQRKQLEKITGIPDVIIVSSTHPFHYFPLYFFAKKHHIQLIFEVRDLWPSSLIELLNLKPWHPLVILLSMIENHAYKNADKIVSLLEFAKPYMQSKGLKSHKFHYIPNGTEVGFANCNELPLEHKNRIEELKNHKKFIIGYAGAMGEPNALTYLIEAMKILQKSNPNIHCILMGDGHQKDLLKKKVAHYQLNNIDFLPKIPKSMMNEFLQRMDVLYLGWQDTELYQYGVSPNKIFDYMLSETPIIESGGAPISLLTKANCGLNCVAANPEKIAASILELIKLPLEKRKTMGQNGKAYVLKHHQYSLLSQQYLDLIKA